MAFITTGALNFITLKIGGYFQFQAAGAREKYKLIDSSHNVTDLSHLRLEPLLFRSPGLSQSDFFFRHS